MLSPRRIGSGIPNPFLSWGYLWLLGARNVPAARVLWLMERPTHGAGLVYLGSQAKKLLFQLKTLVRSKVPSNSPHTDSMILELSIHFIVFCLFQTGNILNISKPLDSRLSFSVSPTFRAVGRSNLNSIYPKVLNNQNLACKCIGFGWN